MTNTATELKPKRVSPKGNLGKRRTHCSNGHEYTPENTKWRTRNKDESTRYQVCVQCDTVGRRRAKVVRQSENYVRRKKTVEELIAGGAFGGDTMTLAEFKKYRGIAS
jgi:hypothetical protein